MADKPKEIVPEALQDPPEKLSPEVQEQQAKIREAVGALIAGWATTETVFLELLLRLSGMSEDVGSIVYFSFTSTRARLRLLTKIAGICCDGKYKDEVAALIKRFDGPTRLRNELAHCDYIPDLKTFAMLGTRAFNMENDPPRYQDRAWDKARMNELRHVTNLMGPLNRDTWRLCEKIGKSKQPTK